MKLLDRCRNIKLLLSDVDGVLTSGELVFDNQGIESKAFHIRDGLGIRLWQRAGFRFGILTARTSHIVRLRAVELGIDIVRQGFEDKLPEVQQVVAQQGLQMDQVCYVGDDLTDLPVIRRVGLGVAVSDAAQEVRSTAHWVTKTQGGRGAVRELIEMLLKSKIRWDDLIRRYLEQ